jgi:predicted PurR-regulated permease PerM
MEGVEPGSTQAPADGRERRGASAFQPQVDEGATAVPVAPGAPVPDLRATRDAVERPEARSIGVTVLAALAVLYTLYFARDFLLPIVFALLLDFFFSPVVRLLARWRIRPPLGALVVLVVLVGSVSVGVYELSGPMQSWAARAPETAMEVQEKMRGLMRPLERVTETAARVEEATGGGDENQEQRVIVEGPSLVKRLFGTTQRLAADILQVLVLLYFLLAAGDLFLQKLVKVLPNVRDKQAAVQVARKTEASISTYLLTATALNIGEALVVMLAMYLLGMPNPLLWGALVVLLEFIPYIGAAIITVVLALAALTVFDTASQAMLVPLTFLAINLVQGNFVSPMLLADRLLLNPVAVFVGLTFWWWIWGIPGAFIAVPMLAALKIVCDHVTPLAAIGEFLGQRDVRERRAIIRSG